MVLVLVFYVEVFKDDNVFNQLDMCYFDNKMENGIRELKNICYMKMGELSRNYFKKWMEQFEIERYKNVRIF